MENKRERRSYTTIQQSVTFRGVGVHTGVETLVTLNPWDAGIVFTKRDRKDVIIPASIESVLNTVHGTSLGNSEISIGMVEHLLATLFAYGINGAKIVVENGSEMPILDGSALPLVEMLRGTKIVNRERIEPPDCMVVKKPFLFTHKESFLAVYPAPELTITYFISYAKYPELTQVRSIVITSKSFEKEIAAARTYAFLEWIEPLRAQGLIKGGNLENSLVYSSDGFLNASLRFPDEPVRHKILDFIGDLSLFGKKIIGHFVVLCGGHTAHIAFLKALARQLESSH
jgi:UDP-3-O-[3-hydroxymyristoyl] N-acetylglucosamine deacetylase